MSHVDWENIKGILAEAGEWLSDHASEASRQQLLQLRASQIAQGSSETVREITATPYLLFHIRQEVYGVPVEHVRSVSTLQRITPIPGVPSFYLGLCNHGGTILSVLDLIPFFSIDSTTQDPYGHLIVLAGAGLSIAVAVHDVVEVRLFDNDETISNSWNVYHDAIQHVTVEGIVLLNVDLLFADPRIRIQEDAS